MWEIHGIQGGGDSPPPWAAAYKGTALVIGSGRCLWDDLDVFLPRYGKENLQERLARWASQGKGGPGGDIIAVNEAGCYLHARLAHWASLHPEHLGTRVAHRNSQGYPPAHVLHTNTAMPQHQVPAGTVQWRLVNPGALSGWFAALLGVVMGYERVVIAGCPMDRTGRFYDPPGVSASYDDSHIEVALRQAIEKTPAIRERVRAVSGKLHSWLGGIETWDSASVAA